MLKRADWVSLSRIPIAIAIVLALENKPLVLLLVALAIFTDFLDGKLAGKGTKLGAIIDPLADKAFVIIVGIAMLRHLPWYYILLFFSRDIFTVLGASICYRYKLKGVKARTFGKMVTITQFLTLAVVFLGWPAEYLIMGIGVLTIGAIIEYVRWFRESARV